MEIKAPETRGKKTRKYDFFNMELGEDRAIPCTVTSNAHTCFYRFVEKYKLNWKCSCYKENGFVHVLRIQ